MKTVSIRQWKGSSQRGWSLLCVLLVALSAGFERPVTAADGEILVEENVTYGTGGGQELKLDIARPAGNGPHPAIVFIHGGGWRGGNRVRYRKEIETAAKKGYVAATVSYRLVTVDKETKQISNAFPAQVEDVKCAVRWLRANAAKYHVNPNKIGATGGSAGGHLSLMLGLTDAEAKLEGTGGHADQSSRVQAVVNVYGPTDMLALHKSSAGAAPILDVFLRGNPGQAADRYKAASPVTYLSPGDPPVLTLHGDKDTLVPIEQAEILDKAMKAAGLSHRTYVLEGQGHGFKPDAEERAVKQMYDFFETHLK